MHLDSRLLSFPLYVCCNFLYTSHQSDNRPDCSEKESSAHSVSWCLSNHRQDTDTSFYVQSTTTINNISTLDMSSLCSVTQCGVTGGRNQIFEKASSHCRANLRFGNFHESCMSKAGIQTHSWKTEIAGVCQHTQSNCGLSEEQSLHCLVWEVSSLSLILCTFKVGCGWRCVSLCSTGGWVRKHDQ